MPRSWSIPFRLAVVTLALCACSKEDLGKFPQLELPANPILPQEDPNALRETPEANVPIYLSSNKQRTSFTINGKPFDEARRIKVLVLQRPLRITAKAYCYVEKVQTASANGFGPSSVFEFTFTDWDKDRANKDPACK